MGLPSIHVSTLLNSFISNADLLTYSDGNSQKPKRISSHALNVRLLDKNGINSQKQSLYTMSKSNTWNDASVRQAELNWTAFNDLFTGPWTFNVYFYNSGKTI